MAQPITLLLSHFYLAGLSDTAYATSTSLFADASQAVDELSTTFRLLQELVYLQSVVPCICATPFTRVLDTLAEDAEAIFAVTGIIFDLRRELALQAASEPGHRSLPDQQVPLLDIDIKRTRGAIAGILHVACAASTPGSRVICSLSTDRHSIVLEFKPLQVQEGAVQESFDERTWLKLGLAKANATGQGASLHMAAQPFALSIRLPLASVPSRPDGYHRRVFKKTPR